MQRLLLSAVLCCALTGALVVAADKAADNKPQTPKTPATQPTTKPSAPINKYCAVDRENPVDPTAGTVVYEGKTIGFCCEDCLPKFKKDPKKYMKDLK